MPAEMRKARWILIVLALVLVFVLQVILTRVLPVATGYAAKIACSAVFVSGRPLEQVKVTDLEGFRFVTLDVVERAGEVRAHVLWLAGTAAVHRPGLGCTLVHDMSTATLHAQDIFRADERAPQAFELVDAYDPVLTSSLGVDRQAMERAIYDAFDEPRDAAPTRTRAVVVLYRGFLVGEGYRVGLGPKTPLLGWSMTKSVLSALIGRAVKQGLLPDLDEPVPISRWHESERRPITWRHLLWMSSGLRFDETYQPPSDATRMLFIAEDAASVALSAPLAHPPGSHWSYSSGTTNILSLLLRRVLGDTRYHAYPYRALFDPLGLEHAVIEPDASGTYVASSFMYATAREWAKIGQLHLQDGMWRGERLLPEGWVDFVTSPAPAAPEREYGAHWWLNLGPAEAPERRALPSVSPDAYFMDGYEGQAVVVVPSRHAVVVRLGQTPPEADFDLDRFVARVLSALPHPEAKTRSRSPRFGALETAGSSSSPLLAGGPDHAASARRRGRAVSAAKRASKPTAVAVNPAVSPHQ